jgi:hypothetical protein
MERVDLYYIRQLFRNFTLNEKAPTMCDVRDKVEVFFLFMFRLHHYSLGRLLRLSTQRRALNVFRYIYLAINLSWKTWFGLTDRCSGVI